MGFVYIITNVRRTVLYIGVTADLKRRITQHKNGVGASFALRNNLKYLVYYEQHDSIERAIAREKQLKNWKREWKDELIHGFNPKWQDLYQGL